MQTVKFYKPIVNEAGVLEGLQVGLVRCVTTANALRVADEARKQAVTVPFAERVMYRLGWKRRRQLSTAELALIPAGCVRVGRMRLEMSKG